VDLGVFYRDARLRLTDLVTEENANVPVPATPAWTVRDVLAHLAGITEDAMAGNMAGVTTDPWTAAQVERGKSKSIAELKELWNTGAPLIEAVLSSPEGTAISRAVIDIATHEADVRHAVGLAARVPPKLLEWVSTTLRSGFLAQVAEVGLPAVVVGANDFEWFRGRLGRRTVTEVMAYGWSEDPTRYLDVWFVFGRATTSINEVWAD
jgi:uncharacterized protein (TIGR03083 family)